ncbi:MAG: efflux RND transporter periplasmic adaptor subunit [Armatimonadota bacterium]
MFRMTILFIVGLLLTTSLVWAGESVVGTAGKFRVELSSQPSPPSVGENLLIIKVFDGDKPLSGAGVDVHLDMTSMPMPADTKATAGANPGEYGATVDFSMAGEWTVEVVVQQMAGMKMDGDGTAHFLVETGKGITAKGPGPRLPWGVILVALLILAGIGAVVLRRRIPQQARGIIAGVLTLAVVLAGTMFVVKKFRDPTVSTVHQSAFMDMSAQAAPGTIAVGTETVQAGSFQSTVSYTGTVVPDSEEDIYPRVTGRLIAMPLYPGDRVTAGQVVARLDTNELRAKENQAAYGSAGAVQGQAAASAEIAAARASQARAQSGVDIARAQLTQAQSAAKSAEGGVKAAQHELVRAKQLVREAESAVSAARAGIDEAQERVLQAQGDVESMQADVTYWTAEIARAKKLYEVGAIAKEELDRETAQAETAKAKLHQAKAAVRTAQAGVKRAQQELAQAQARQAAAEADIATAEARQDQMLADRESASGRVTETQAMLQTALADARGADAALSAATAKSGMAQAELRRAQAALQEASTVRGYTDIRASYSGVVTARMIAPGVLVQPGMAILKIAKIDHVRLQVNVSEADLAGIRLRQRLTAHTINDSNRRIVGKVTAIFPVRDTSARTAVVEARVPNSDGRLQPGQYLSVDLELDGTRQHLITVPNHAVLRRDGETSVMTVVNDGFQSIAKRVTVTTGGMSNTRTAILRGLEDGAVVVVSGQDNLRDGDKVTVVQESTYTPPALEVADVPKSAGMDMSPRSTPTVKAPADKHARHRKPAPTPQVTPPRQPAAVSSADMYRCSMHPEVKSTKPGKCPKCGMDLVKEQATKQFVCPMHPEVTSTKPGSCPKCGMDLEEKK